MLKIIQIVFFVLAFNSFAYAEEIKLECEFTAKLYFNNIDKSYDKGTAILEVTDSGDYKYISINSSVRYMNGSVSISPVKKPNQYDKSDENKWDITETMNTKNDNGSFNKLTQQISIDRNSGFFKYMSNWNENSNNPNKIEVSSTGKCNKVNTSERKF